MARHPTERRRQRPVLQGAACRSSQAGGRGPRDVLRRFPDRRPAQGGMGYLAPADAPRAASPPRVSRRGHQRRGRGLLLASRPPRFLQEVDRYQPDLVLVSFGWNDAAEAIGQPDKSFQAPPWPVVLCQCARSLSSLSRVDVLHSVMEDPAAGAAGGLDQSASERRGLPDQSRAIPLRGRVARHPDRVPDPAA